MQTEAIDTDESRRIKRRREMTGGISHSCLLFLLLTAAVASIPLSSPALASLDEASGTVTKVVDGNTFDIKVDMADSRVSYNVERVSLADVSSPELETPRGPAARDFTWSVLMGKRVYLDIDDLSDGGRDSEGSLVSLVYLTGVYGQPIPYPNFNLLLVEAGYAEISNQTDNEFDPADWVIDEDQVDEYQSEDGSLEALQRLEDIQERMKSKSASSEGSILQAPLLDQQGQGNQQISQSEQDLESSAEKSDGIDSNISNNSNSSLLSRIEDAAIEELNQTAQSAWDWFKGEVRNNTLELVNGTLERALNSN